jgi:ABC-2 type transport system permease protein
MQAYWTLMRRELAGFFLSITGYVLLAGTTFLVGFSFWSLLRNLEGDSIPMPVTELFYMTAFFWLILLLAVPVITMRLFAHEKFSGTYETLMTTPVSDLQVLAAKFSAALALYMILWLPLLACIFILRHYTSDPTGLDAGVVGSTFLGIFLVGCLFISLGCFASSLTRSQMTAAMISMVLCVSLFLVSCLAKQRPTSDWQAQVLSFFALRDQMHDFARGVVDTRPVVLYLSLTFFFLFLTLRVLGSRRWK